MYIVVKTFGEVAFEIPQFYPHDRKVRGNYYAISTIHAARLTQNISFLKHCCEQTV